ncbi:MAG: YbaN family protein [Planctomycetota bacterium]
MPAKPPSNSIVATAVDGPRVVRWVYASAGGVALTLGSIGVVVPGWPTTIFWLIAAWCFSKSCPVLQRWVYTRPGVGPVILDLLEHRRLTLANKRRAIAGIWVGISLSAGVMLLLDYSPIYAIVLAAVAAGVSLWLHFGFTPEGRD